MILPTSKQFEALRVIFEYGRDHGIPPTFEEIGNALKISKPAAYGICKELRSKGYIDWQDEAKRTITILRPGLKFIEVADELKSEPEIPEKYIRGLSENG